MSKKETNDTPQWPKGKNIRKVWVFQSDNRDDFLHENQYWIKQLALQGVAVVVLNQQSSTLWVEPIDVEDIALEGFECEEVHASKCKRAKKSSVDFCLEPEKIEPCFNGHMVEKETIPLDQSWLDEVRDVDGIEIEVESDN